MPRRARTHRRRNVTASIATLVLASLGAASPASAQTPACPPHQHASADHCCPSGQAWLPNRRHCMRATSEAACRAGNTAECLSATDALLAASPAPDDAERAATLLDLACSHDEPRACVRLGDLRAGPTLGAPDLAAAASLYGRGCDAHFPAACAHLAAMLFAGRGVTADPARAESLASEACEGAVHDGCSTLALRARALAHEGASASDREHALALATRACDGDAGDACTIVGDARAASGTPSGLGDARTLYERACMLAAGSGCAQLGRMYEAGRGVTADLAEAGRLYIQACGAEGHEACADARALAARFERNDAGVRQDYPRAASLYRVACYDGHDQVACGRLGFFFAYAYGVSTDVPRAQVLLDGACAHGAAQACLDLGNMYANGRGLPRDAIRAAPLFHRACDGGIAEGCYNLGIMCMAGNGERIDIARATELFHRACNQGYQRACQALEH